MDHSREILICRICLNIIKPPDKATSINDYTEKINSEKILIRDVVQMTVCEMDLDISDNVVLCDPCKDAVINIYVFKTKCLQTEEKIYTYMEQNHIRFGDKVDLLNLLDHTEEEEVETVIISDSDVQYMSSSETVKVHDMSQDEDTIIDVTTVSALEADHEESSITPKRGPSYSCARCEYKSYRKIFLERHIHYYCKNRVKAVIYKCDLCPYECFRNSYLKRHKLTHKRKRPYKCGICDRCFAKKNHIRMHILYKHSVSDLRKQYKCGMEDCEATFHRKSDYNSHITTHVTYRPYMCRMCKKGFFSEMQWNTHMEDVHGLLFFPLC